MIEVRNLSKRYPGNVHAVRDIQFEVSKGQIVGFLGPNGAGKSTTMRILTGYLAPTSGSASIGGFDTMRQSRKVRRMLGYLPESNPLYTEMRVREFLNFRATLKEVPRRERRAAVDEAVAACSLGDVADRVIEHLSKGYRQRVGLADAIVHKPDVIILDEPTIGLDPNQVREVRALIRRLGEQRTVILSTHILSEVELMCRRVIVIHRGTIRADGNPKELAQDKEMKRNIRVELRAPEGRTAKTALESIPGVARVIWSDNGDVHRYVVEPKDAADLRPEIYALSVAKHWSVVEIAHDTSALEDLFSRLTQEEAAS